MKKKHKPAWKSEEITQGILVNGKPIPKPPPKPAKKPKGKKP